MELKKLNGVFSVCRVNDLSEVDLSGEFVFVGKTDEEISVVCLTGNVPQHTLEREDGWRAFRIQGVLDFSLIGILSRISAILAEHQIGIFVVSTYNTDYVLTKEASFPQALACLEEAGYQIV